MSTVDDLAAFPMLAPLSAEQLATLAAIARPASFAAGTRLFDEGQPAEHCWLIRSGRVLLETDFPGAGPTVVQTVGAGEVLGWSWLVPPYRWRFGAVAPEPVEAVAFDAEPLRELIHRDPALGCPLMLGLFEALLSRLHGTRARMLDLYGSPRER